MPPIKNIIIRSGLLLCMSNLVHAGGLPADQTATTGTSDSQQTAATQATAEQTTQTATPTAPAQTQQPAAATPPAAGQTTPAAPVPAPGMPPGTVAPAPGTAPGAPATTGVAPATAAPGTTTADGAYVPRTQYDNTPHRFNMTQEGKRMSADDFDAWMRAKGYRVATGRPPADCPNVPPAGVETIVGPDGCPVEVSIDLEGVTFEFGKTALRAEAKKTLDQAIEILKRHPELTVEVAGHTDSRGSNEVNQRVSEARAKAVYDYLIKNGIAASKLEGPIGYGESKPIAPNDTDAGREKNRRTELNIKATSVAAGAAPAAAAGQAAGAAAGQAAGAAAGEAAGAAAAQAAGAAEAGQAAGAAAGEAAGAVAGQAAGAAAGQAAGAAAGQQGETKPEADSDQAEPKPEPEKTPR